MPFVARPLVRPAPRSAMFFPLVVLVAVLPGLIALNSWDLTPPGPLWGLRAMAVLDGMVLDQVPAAADMKSLGEAAAFRKVAFQPPLYSWLAALGLKISAECNPLASVLPSYMAGAVVVVLVYLHGRLWRGGGLGLIAALLIGFNPNLLLRMQEATPSTLALAGTLAALLCYGWHEQCLAESIHPWPWTGPVFWVIAGGLSLGLSLLTLGGFGLFVIPVVVLHQLYLAAGASPARTRSRRWWQDCWRRPGLINALLAMAIALTVAIPWHVLMVQAHGWQAFDALKTPPGGWGGDRPGLLSRLFELVPVTLPLALYGAVRAIRLALIDENNTRETVGGSFWVIWLAVAALAPTVWSSGPQQIMDLFLLVPLSLLAAQTIADLVNRRIPVRALVGLAPATAMSVAWWTSEDLQRAVGDLLRGQAGAGTALGLHIALDLVLVSIWLIRALDRWARRRDDRQRQVLAMFLLSVLAITVGAGIREVVFRHSETHDLLTLRTMILRRNRERPFNLMAVVSPDPVPFVTESPSPGGRLRFILRTALPKLPQLDLSTIDELLVLPEGQRLIILAGAGQRLSSAVQSKLGLETIHPGRSGVLDAYATAYRRPSRH